MSSDKHDEAFKRWWYDWGIENRYWPTKVRTDLTRPAFLAGVAYALSAEGSGGALREIAKMMDEAEAVLRSEVLAGNVVKESAARGELVGLRRARAVLTVPLNESHALRREPGKARTPQEVAEQWKDWIPYPDSSVAEWDRFTLASYIARSATGDTK